MERFIGVRGDMVESLRRSELLDFESKSIDEFDAKEKLISINIKQVNDIDRI